MRAAQANELDQSQKYENILKFVCNELDDGLINEYADVFESSGTLPGYYHLERS